MSSTLSRLAEIFQDVFDDGEIAVSGRTSAADIEARVTMHRGFTDLEVTQEADAQDHGTRVSPMSATTGI